MNEIAQDEYPFGRPEPSMGLTMVDVVIVLVLLSGLVYILALLTRSVRRAIAKSRGR